MNELLTSEQRLQRFDDSVDSLKTAFVTAVEELQVTTDVDSSIDERWAEIARRLRELPSDLRQEDYDKEQLAALYKTMLEIRDLLDGDRSADMFDGLLVRIERIRHVVRDALDEYVEGIVGDTGLIVGEVNAWLPDIPKHDIATLVGVDRRTWTRWAGTAKAPSRRLRTVARLIAILRHNWTEEGIIAWFHRPRRDLGGKTPLASLGDVNFDEDALVMAARAGRSQYAS